MVEPHTPPETAVAIQHVCNDHLQKHEYSYSHGSANVIVSWTRTKPLIYQTFTVLNDGFLCDVVKQLIQDLRQLTGTTLSYVLYKRLAYE